LKADDLQVKVFKIKIKIKIHERIESRRPAFEERLKRSDA